jgi:predicted RNA-binding protein with RPS1 domain
MRPEDVVTVGKRYTFRIISVEPVEHRLGLSLKPDAKPKEPKERKEPHSPRAKKETPARKSKRPAVTTP